MSDSWIHYLYRKSGALSSSPTCTWPATPHPAPAGGTAVHLFFVAFFYVYAMHHHFRQGLQAQRSGADHGSCRHHRFLLVTGLLSACMALGLGAYLVLLPFIFVLLMERHRADVAASRSCPGAPGPVHRHFPAQRDPRVQDHVHRGGLGGAGPHSGWCAQISAAIAFSSWPA